jgi:putative ABC transport system substrate-binding protein
MGRLPQVVALMFIMLMPWCPAQAAGEMVGVIMTGDIKYYRDIHDAFIKGMSGMDVEVVVQKPTPEPMSWANAARKLVALDSDVIVSYGTPATLMTMKATSEIPIVFAAVYTPKAMKVTGKNATGISSTVPMRTIVEDLKTIKDFLRLGVIFNKSEKDTILQAREIKKLGTSMGFKTVLFSVRKTVNSTMIKDIDALLLTASCAGMQCIKDVVSLARKDKVPTASAIKGGERTGVVLTIAAKPEEQGREAANMVKKVLGGTKVSDIPVMEPQKIDKIINVKEASAIGINVPSKILGSATEVIR